MRFSASVNKTAQCYQLSVSPLCSRLKPSPSTIQIFKFSQQLLLKWWSSFAFGTMWYAQAFQNILPPSAGCVKCIMWMLKWCHRRKCVSHTETLNSHWLRTILAPFPTLHSCDWLNYLRISYITHIFFITSLQPPYGVIMKIGAVYSPKTSESLICD